MSFKQNDSNDTPMIHLGNYEEFFILYLDNELSDEQMKLVDEFLTQHPDLQAEFEILSGVRLPMEEMEIDKSSLMAQSMKLNIVDEELLLYLDNELPAGQKKIVELELKNNKDYQLQYQSLQATRLDASEKISYPNKKELYRKEERRVIAFAPWMRVAAAVLVIAIAGVLYFTNSPGTSTANDMANTGEPKKVQPETVPSPVENNKDQIAGVGKETEKEIAKEKEENKELNTQVAVKGSDRIKKEKKQNPVPQIKNEPGQPDLVPGNDMAYNETSDPVTPTRNIAVKTMDNNSTASIHTPSSVNLNNRTVTSVVDNRKINEAAAPTTEVASTKGSVKGFLRKTTRLIEKRTGIDATNDGELLIGAVAINLK